MEFTYSAYKNMIWLLKEHGYTFCDYVNYGEYDKSVIIRHDVDRDSEKALAFSEMEREEGISTTYSVLLTSNFYNVFSRKNREILRKICENGHTIGLHFDETQYCHTDRDWWKEAIDREMMLLEQCIGRPVTSVAMHRVSKEALEEDWRIQDGRVINTYGKEFMQKHKYVSDSRRNWKEDVMELIREERYNRLHMLVHPFWYDLHEKSAKEVLRSFCREQVYRCYDELNRDTRDLNELLEKSELSRQGEWE